MAKPRLFEGIGAPVKRREDFRLLSGRGRYAEDWNAPGQAHAAFVRSPHAHAEVVSADAKPALALEGVLGVFTGRDLVAAGVGPIPTLIAERGGGIRSRDGSAFAEPPWFPLATDTVRHVGEPVAIVVAATAAAARDAAEAVRVRYAERPPVVDAVAALAEGAPRLHAGVEENRAYDWECGDGEATARAIAAAAHVTRLTLVDNRLITCFLEPRAALAEWDAGAGRYTLYEGLQSVHQLAANLARVLGVAAERVRCVTADVGGGFGSKIQVYPEYAAVAWAARRLGRAVKWVSTRSEGFVSDVQSRDHLLRGELALDAAGRVTALRVHSTPNLGAYVAPSIPISTLSNMERMISGLYAIPAIHLRVEGALTTTVPINVYRGVGRIECVYTVERLIEQAARETGRDRVALRRANMVRAFPYRTATGAVYDSGDYVARLDEALELADPGGFASRRADAARRGRGLGRRRRRRPHHGGASPRSGPGRHRVRRRRVPRRRHGPVGRDLRARARGRRGQAAAGARHHARRREDAREPGVRVRQRLRGVRAGGRPRDRRGRGRRPDHRRRFRPLGESDDRARPDARRGGAGDRPGADGALRLRSGERPAPLGLFSRLRHPARRRSAVDLGHQPRRAEPDESARRQGRGRGRHNRRAG